MYENNSFAEGYAIGRDSNGYGDGMFGGNGCWWILLLFLFGWGGNGFGFGGGHMMNYATTGDVQRGFDTSAMLGKLDGITNGLCDGFYALNTGLLNGFNGVNLNLCNLSHEISDCCCATQRAIADVRYDLATNTCDIKNTIHNETGRILDYLTSEKISSLQLENQALKFQASQTAQNSLLIANNDAQTAELIRRLGRDVPVPAYVVPNPNCCYTMPYPATATTGCGCGAI
jgi:hypothetical protein